MVFLSRYGETIIKLFTESQSESASVLKCDFIQCFDLVLQLMDDSEKLALKQLPYKLDELVCQMI